MKILAIDDNPQQLDQLVSTIRRIRPHDEIVSFRHAEDFFAYKEKSTIGIAFVDINLGSISGIQVAMELKRFSPLCNIIYVTAYSEFAFAAMQTRPSGYVLKPYSEQDIREEFEHLRYLAQTDDFVSSEVLHDLLKVRTFGSFSVMDSRGVPIRFSRTVSKEIFAYLIDQCGFPVTSWEIAADVLECQSFTNSDSKKISQYLSDLIRDLEAAGYSNIVIKQNRQIQVNKSAVDCDLYHALEGSVSALNSYHGEYLTDYAWAEFGYSFNRINAFRKP